MAGTLRWTLLMPLKVLPGAKSRLAEQLTPSQHAELVRAIRSDTLAAARAAAPVVRVLVVADQPFEDADIVQHSPGLNGALRDAAAHAVRHWPDDGIAALVGDLPALRPIELAAALGTEHARAYVPDAAGTGTTLLAVRPGGQLDPRFGAGSAARHDLDAVRLDAGAGLRRDVDTRADLEAAVELGVGPATRTALVRVGSFMFAGHD